MSLVSYIYREIQDFRRNTFYFLEQKCIHGDEIVYQKIAFIQ